MNKKKHLVFLTPGFPKDEEDTRCIPALHLFAHHMHQHSDFTVTIIALQYPYIEKKYFWKNIPVYAQGGKNKKGLTKIFLWKKTMKLISKIHNESPIFRIHGFWYNECALIGNKISNKLNIPYATTFMGQDVLKSNRYLKRLTNAETIITLSNFHRQILRQNSNLKNDIIIPWAIENHHIKKVEKTIDIIGVGNLVPNKNYREFLHIISIIENQYAPLQVQIIGEGPELKKLKEQASKLQSKITFTGPLTREETLDKMNQSKVLLHTSLFESFGMVIIEGLARGVKVFSYPTGIASELKNVSIIQNDIQTAKEITEYLNYSLNNPHPESEIPLTIEDTCHSYIKKVFLKS